MDYFSVGDIRALETLSKILEKGLGDTVIRGKILTIQTTTLLKLPYLIRRILEISDFNENFL